MGMKKRKIKTKAPKPRNWLAVHARARRGGPMQDRKKQKNKMLCRKKVRA